VGEMFGGRNWRRRKEFPCRVEGWLNICGEYVGGIIL